MQISDLAAMAIAFFAASISMGMLDTSHNTLIEFFAVRIKLINFIMFIVLILLWHCIFTIFQLHENPPYDQIENQNIINILKATSSGTILIILMGFFFNLILITKSFILIFWLLVIVITLVSRIIVTRVFINNFGREINTRNILIVGSGKRIHEFVEKQNIMPTPGYRIIGFIDAEWQGSHKLRMHGVEYLGSIDHIGSILDKQYIDEVLIGLPLKSFYAITDSIIKICEERGITVKLFIDLFHLKNANIALMDFEGQPVASI